MFNARNDDRSLQAAAATGNPSGNPKGNGTDTSEDRKHGEGPVPSPMKRERTRKDGKGHTKGNGPRGTSPSGKPNKPVCCHYKKGNAKRNPHVIIGRRQKMLPHDKTQSLCSPERCSSSFGRPRARSSRLASSIYGRIGRRRILIIRQCW